MKPKGQCWTCKKKAEFKVGSYPNTIGLCKTHYEMRIKIDNSPQSKLGAILTDALNRVAVKI